MVQLRLIVLLLALVQYTLGAGHIKKAYAHFNGRGVVGRISFEEDGDQVQITTSFTSLPDNTGLGYHVHDWPVEYTQDPSLRCGEVGGHYDPYDKQSTPNYATVCMNNSSECEVGDLSGKHGKLMTGNSIFSDTLGLSLSNFHSIVFRSIVIHNTDSSRLTCATILPETDSASDVIVARARFNGPTVGGSIWFFQPSSAARDTYIHSDLFFTNSGSEETNYDWSIYKSPAGSDARRGVCTGVGETRFTTRTGDVTCDATDASTCHEYELTNKHGSLPIGNGRNRRSFSEYDGIKLYGENRITNLSIRIETVSGMVIACASIKKVSFIRATADFSTYGIQAIEYSPFLPTPIKYTGNPVDITRQSINTEGYYSERVCDSSLQVYSPYPPFAPAVGVNYTQDIYEVGNLTDVLSDTWVWHNTLPLSGPYSTIGRTASIKYGESWECSEWQDDFSYRGEDRSFIYRARAVFEPSPCWVSFSQRVSSDVYEIITDTPTNLPDFDTGEVTIFEYCPGGNPSRKYRIQTTDMTRYNPYWVKSAAMNLTEYDRDCSPFRPERCEVGDLDRLDLELTRWTGIHTNLELLGRYRTTGRFLQMYTDGGGMDTTAEIVPLYSERFSVCISSCEVANARTYIVPAIHTLVDVTCESPEEDSACGANEYQVDGRVTGGSASEAEQNFATLSRVLSAGYQLRATFLFTSLSLVLLSLLYMC